MVELAADETGLVAVIDSMALLPFRPSGDSADTALLGQDGGVVFHGQVIEDG